MKTNISAFIGLIFLPLFASAHLENKREIALSFDDCPRKTVMFKDGLERAKQLTRKLKEADVSQVVFFCNSPDLKPDGYLSIQHFASEGHLIANHTATHADMNAMPLEDYFNDFTKADSALKSFPNFRKWFRFPFLHEGKNPTDVKAARKFLKQVGYKNGYVTVMTEDWYMEALLREAISKKRKSNHSNLCSAYKNILADEAEFYDGISVKVLGRSVRHVMLLHETDLNALCIGEVVQKLREKGWKIISPDLAYQDPIASTDPSDSVRLSQGRVYALAADLGYKGPFHSKWYINKNVQQEFALKKVWE